MQVACPSEGATTLTRCSWVLQCRGLCRNALQDEPPKLLPPHAEDPGTPELDQLVLPRGSFDRRELLKLEREVKKDKMTDTEYQWRLRLCMTPTPSASDVRKVKSSISKSKGAQGTRRTRTQGESSTVTSKSQDLGLLRFFFFSCLCGFHWLDPGHMFELVRCLLDFSIVLSGCRCDIQFAMCLFPGTLFKFFAPVFHPEAQGHTLDVVSVTYW